MKLCERVKNLRTTYLRATNVCFADATGISSERITSIELGRAEPTLGEALAIARAADISVEALVGGEFDADGMNMFDRAFIIEYKRQPSNVRDLWRYAITNRRTRAQAVIKTMKAAQWPMTRDTFLSIIAEKTK